MHHIVCQNINTFYLDALDVCMYIIGCNAWYCIIILLSRVYTLDIMNLDLKEVNIHVIVILSRDVNYIPEYHPEPKIF